MGFKSKSSLPSSNNLTLPEFEPFLRQAGPSARERARQLFYRITEKEKRKEFASLYIRNRIMDLKVLEILDKAGPNPKIDSLDLANKLCIDHQKAVGVIKSLECLPGEVIRTEIKTKKKWELTQEGKAVAEKGSHEAAVFNSVPEGESLTQTDLVKAVGVESSKVGLGKALANGWVALDRSKKPPEISRKVDEIKDEVKDNLKLLELGNELEKSKLDEYKKRKLLQEVSFKVYTVWKGDGFTTSIKKAETELTPEMIASGNWKDVEFKPYNFDALGILPPAGHLHPLLKVRSEYRQIFLEMGFNEMPTNNFVESSFWNFDALFQPQQHPARDAHDTFFISDPAEAHQFPQDYLERVKKVHSEGGFGSQGYRCEWKLSEAKKNLLRTHTTAVSSRMLHKLMEKGDRFVPQKYFSIDRVFRNETLDATHLAEFHQIEGVIADYGLTLGDLIGTLHEFFRKLGIDKLRFKPAYNPYTEPSMEIFSYHEGLGKWVEIGNSGVFRPEMLLPMGLPEGVHVIAWGLGLERCRHTIKH